MYNEVMYMEISCNLTKSYIYLFKLYFNSEKNSYFVCAIQILIHSANLETFFFLNQTMENIEVTCVKIICLCNFGLKN